MNKNNNENIRPTPPEQLNALVGDAFKDSGFLDRKGPRALADNERLLEECKTAVHETQQLMRSVVNADHAKGGRYNDHGAFQLAFVTLRDKLSKMSKDELLWCLTEINCEFLMEGLREYAQGLIEPL